MYSEDFEWEKLQDPESGLAAECSVNRRFTRLAKNSESIFF